MISAWLRHLRRSLASRPLPPQGPPGIAALGHRAYVGGRWEEIGRLQFDFLLARGLRPDSYLLDIACGALRLGVRAIPYLEPGRYLGIEKEAELVRAGLERELDPRVRAEKRPQFVISSSFEFEKFARRADFAIAQSLFTHLPAEGIRACLRRLHPWLAKDGVLYATYFRSERSTGNPEDAHDHAFFAYTPEEMVAFGETLGYDTTYLGAWNHPRGQVMVEYRPRPYRGAAGEPGP